MRSSAVRGVAAAVLFASVMACGGGGDRTLVVDLRTDYVAMAEVVQVETEIVSSSARDVQTATLSPISDLLGGVNVGGFSSVGAGSQTVEVRLLAPGPVCWPSAA